MKVAYKKAFLIHIVAIMRLYIILLHLVLQNSKVLLRGRFRLGTVPLYIEGIEVFVVKDSFISSSEVCRPVLSRLYSTDQRGLSTDYCRYRR